MSNVGALINLKCACNDDHTLRNPVLLPCGHSACNECCCNMKNVTCHVCGEVVKIVAELAPNHHLDSIIKSGLLDFDIGPKHAEATSALNKIKESLADLYAPAESVFYDKLADIRNKVDLRREILKQRIDSDAENAHATIAEFVRDNKKSVKKEADKKELEREAWNAKICAWTNDLAAFDNKLWCKVSSEIAQDLVKIEKSGSPIQNLDMSRLVTLPAQIGASEFEGISAPFLCFKIENVAINQCAEYQSEMVQLYGVFVYAKVLIKEEGAFVQIHYIASKENELELDKFGFSFYFGDVFKSPICIYPTSSWHFFEIKRPLMVKTSRRFFYVSCIFYAFFYRSFGHFILIKIKTQ